MKLNSLCGTPFCLFSACFAVLTKNISIIRNFQDIPSAISGDLFYNKFVINLTYL